MFIFGTIFNIIVNKTGTFLINLTKYWKIIQKTAKKKNNQKFKTNLRIFWRYFDFDILTNSERKVGKIERKLANLKLWPLNCQCCWSFLEEFGPKEKNQNTIHGWHNMTCFFWIKIKALLLPMYYFQNIITQVVWIREFW